MLAHIRSMLVTLLVSANFVYQFSSDFSWHFLSICISLYVVFFSKEKKKKRAMSVHLFVSCLLRVCGSVVNGYKMQCTFRLLLKQRRTRAVSVHLLCREQVCVDACYFVGKCEPFFFNLENFTFHQSPVSSVTWFSGYVCVLNDSFRDVMRVHNLWITDSCDPKHPGVMDWLQVQNV